jgi:hypothetical protein
MSPRGSRGCRKDENEANSRQFFPPARRRQIYTKTHIVTPKTTVIFMTTVVRSSDLVDLRCFGAQNRKLYVASYYIPLLNYNSGRWGGRFVKRHLLVCILRLTGTQITGKVPFKQTAVPVLRSSRVFDAVVVLSDDDRLYSLELLDAFSTA